MRCSLFLALTGRRVIKSFATFTFVTFMATGLSGLLAGSPALAACTNNTPANGETVTCSGTDTTGVVNPAANGVTVTIAPGATLSNTNQNEVIWIGSNLDVSNSGTISGGASSIGIKATDGNNSSAGIVNAGLIALGNTSLGMDLGDMHIVTNSGSITAGLTSVGILVGSNNNLTGTGGTGVTNSGTITLTSGNGISVQNTNIVTNSGQINVATGSFAGIVGNASNMVTNSGTITMGGNNAAGISLGINNTVNNTGAITSVGTNDFGIAVSTGSTITNSGSVTVSDTGTALYTDGSSIVTNSGTLTVGQSGFGIRANDGNSFGAGITNSGTITVGAFSAGIIVGDSNVVHNDGTITTPQGFADGVRLGTNNIFSNTGLIQAKAEGYSVYSAPAIAGSNAVGNSGTLDGVISLNVPGDSLTNAGLITITDPNVFVGVSHAVNGDFLQGPAGTLALRVLPATRDSLELAGTATLDGTLRAVVQPGLYGNTSTYLGVVSALTIGGNFATIASSSPFFTATTMNSVTSVDLTLTRIGFNAVGGLNKNQTAVGSALEAGYSTLLTGNAATMYGNLLATTGSPGATYSQLSGEGVTASQDSAFFAGSMFNSIIMDQVTGWQGGGGVSSGDSALGYAPESEGSPAFKAVKAPYAPVERSGWRAWFAAFGGKQSMKGDTTTGSADATQNIAGGVFGIERRVDASLSYGFAVGVSDTRFNVSDLNTSGSATAGHFGVYGVKNWSSLYFAGALNYARVNNKVTRNVTAPGISETEEGTFTSNQFGGRFEGGYKMRFGSFGVTPFAAMQFSYLMQPGYTESSSGPGLFALTYGSQTVTSLPAFLGAQVDTRYTFGNGMALMPFARLSWVHEFKPTRQITASFNSVPASGFTVEGGRAASDAARLDAGAKLAINDRWSAFASLGGEFSTRSSNYSASGGIRYAW